MATVLDLPITEQEKLAERQGKTWMQWRSEVIKFLDDAKAHTDEMEGDFEFVSDKRKAEVEKRYKSEEQGMGWIKDILS